MRVEVWLSGIDSGTRSAVESHIREKWGSEKVLIRPPGGAVAEGDALLVIGRRPEPITKDGPISDLVEVAEKITTDSTDALLFQVDAKLGKLTNSELAAKASRSIFAPRSTVSRRELLFGAGKGFAKRSDVPVVFDESCEARYGCSRCVQACPSRAVTLRGQEILVSEIDCTRCGLCAAACLVGAVQMPKFSAAAFSGLLDAIDRANAPRKTLVLTCDSRAVSSRSGVDVEEVADVGFVGPRQLAIAASSSLGAVVVYCPDGLCKGRDSARNAVDVVSAVAAAGKSRVLLKYFEGRSGAAELAGLRDSSGAGTPVMHRSGDLWKDHVAALKSLAGGEDLPPGLGFSALNISEGCTLCESCVKACPHGALRADESHIFFDPSLCTGCGNCSGVCPEHSITLLPSRQRLSATLSAVKVFEDQLFLCMKCGAPIATVRSMKKLTEALGPGNDFVKYCQSCKQRLVYEGSAEKISGGR